MRIGVYVDGFNLYYGARSLCGRGTPGWRWLDLRGLAAHLVGRARKLVWRPRVVRAAGARYSWPTSVIRRTAVPASSEAARSTSALMRQ